MRGKARFAGMALAAFAVLMAAQSRAQDDTTFFRIGTGPAADTEYALGSSIAAGITNPPGSRPCHQGGSCGVPGLIAVAQTKSGSSENLQAIGTGQLESALVHSDMAYWAYSGLGPFEGGALENLRAIANLIPVSLHVVVLADSGIDSMRDLRGKRVSLGPRGSGGATNASYVLGVHGIKLADIGRYYLKPGPATDALTLGRIDAMFVVGGSPIQAIADLAEKREIRLLPFGEIELRQIASLYPFFRGTTIPAGTYRGVNGDTPTVGVGVLWVVAAQVDDLLVQDATRALWTENTAKFLRGSHPEGSLVSIGRALENLPIPLHPGAEAYYRKRGLM